MCRFVGKVLSVRVYCRRCAAAWRDTVGSAVRSAAPLYTVASLRQTPSLFCGHFRTQKTAYTPPSPSKASLRVRSGRVQVVVVRSKRETCETAGPHTSPSSQIATGAICPLSTLRTAPLADLAAATKAQDFVSQTSHDSAGVGMRKGMALMTLTGSVDGRRGRVSR